jgi:hypothetical protein
MNSRFRRRPRLTTVALLIASGVFAPGCQSGDSGPVDGAAPATGSGGDAGSGVEAAAGGPLGEVTGDAGGEAGAGEAARSGEAGTAGDAVVGSPADAAPFEASAASSVADGGDGSIDATPFEASAGSGDATAPDSPLESIEVPASTGSGVSQTSLDNGELFLLRASGTVDFGGTAVDAEFGGFDAAQPGTDTVGGVDVGVDFGLKTVRAAVPPVPGRMKWFGAYSGNHVYYVVVNGTGSPLSLKLLAPAAGAGSGSISVSLYRLSPTLQPVGTLVDTVTAPVTETPAMTTVVPTLGAVYLLQCDGEAKTGGNNLGMGDADWMDYAADGTGQEDIGDANTDYGLGVDEPFVGSANSNTPRKRWWGLWRADHIYYMLYTGTGNPIEFNYYDSGYGDNSTTVTLTVRVRALPMTVP